MKKIFVLSALFVATLLTLGLTSCSKDEVDTQLPVIELEEPEDGDELLIGDDIHFEVDFSDNVMLGSYMIEIHNNFDGHSHKVAPLADNVPFFFKKDYDLKGLRNTHVHHHDVVIPANATPGKYHFIVYCTDAAGNQTQVVRDVILSTTADPHHHDD